MLEKLKTVGKGWRTILLNAGIAAATVLLSALMGVDWVAIVGPHVAVIIVASLNAAMRFVTDTPVGVK